MRKAPNLRFLLACAGLGVAAGCTHNHYYGAIPVCEAPLISGQVVSAPVVAGTYCDVPGSYTAPVVVARNPGRAQTVITDRRPPARVVISEPAGRTALGGWRNTRESSAATTRISGAAEDESVVR